MLSNLPNLDRYLQKEDTMQQQRENNNEDDEIKTITTEHQGSGTRGSDMMSGMMMSHESSMLLTRANTEHALLEPSDGHPGHHRHEHLIEAATTAQHPCCSAVLQLSNAQTHLESQSNHPQQQIVDGGGGGVGAMSHEILTVDTSDGKSGGLDDEESFRMGYRAESDYDEDEDDHEDDEDEDDEDMDDDDDEEEESSDEEFGEEERMLQPDLSSIEHHHHIGGGDVESEEGDLDQYLEQWAHLDVDRKAVNPSTMAASAFPPKQAQASAVAGAAATTLSALHKIDPHQQLVHQQYHQYHQHSGSGTSTPAGRQTMEGSRRRESAMSSTGSTTHESTVESQSTRQQRSAIDVEAFVDKIIEECEFSDCDSLTFIEFKTWLERNDAILNMFTDCLHEEAWGLQGNALYRRIGGGRTGRRQRRFNIIHRGHGGNEDGSKRGVVEIRPDGFYKVKRLFTLPTNSNIAAMLAAHPQHQSALPNQTLLSTAGALTTSLPPKSNTAAPSLTRTSSGPPSPRQHSEEGALAEAITVTPPDVTPPVHEFLPQPQPQQQQHQQQQQQHAQQQHAPSSLLEPASALDVEIYPRQTREVLNHQLIDLILESNPGLDMSSLEAGRIPQEDILACPACRSLLVVCPLCHRRCPNIRLKNGSVVIECNGCLDGQPHEFHNCWHCHWNFDEAPDWVDQCEPLYEGTLFKIGKHTHKWRSRYFVLVDNLLYYYGRKEDTKPKGFFFLEGCFVEAIHSGSSKSDATTASGAASTALHPASGIDGLETSSTRASTSAPSSTTAPLIKLSVPSASGAKHGFSIVHGGGKVPRRDLYASKDEEREAWTKALRAAMNQQRIDEAYRLGAVVGQGKFSIVYRALAKDTNQEVAIKVIDKSKISGHEKELLRSEIAILRLLRHPHVISLREVFLDCQKSIYIVMEYVKGGELYDLIQQKRRLPELHVNRIIFQLLTTVAYLHKCGIIHRDLKPENILLTDKTTDADIKITDFGLSCICGMDELVTQPCGTLAYVAPEVLTLKGYNHKVDVWSVGVIMYLLLRGRLPFPVGRVAGVAKSATMYRQLTFDGPIWDNVCSSAKDLLRKLLQPTPEKRISAQEALQHIWIKNPTAVISEGPPDEESSAENNNKHNGRSSPPGSKDHSAVDATPRMSAVTGTLRPAGSQGALTIPCDSSIHHQSSHDLPSQLLDVSASTFSVPLSLPTSVSTSPPTVISHIDGAAMQIPITTTTNQPSNPSSSSSTAVASHGPTAIEKS